MRILVQATLIGAVLGIALSAAAQTQSAKPAKTPPDPNKIVCEDEEVVGSRLATRRVCMTRAEWAERRHNDRMVVERTQTQRCNAGNGCAGQ